MTPSPTQSPGGAKRSSLDPTDAAQPQERKADLVPDTAGLDEIDRQIAIVRDNLRQLMEQAAALSGANDEDRASERISEQEAELATLLKQRELLAKKAKR